MVRLSDLLPALERAAPGASGGLVDEEVAAFISARLKGRMDSEFETLAVAENPDIDPPGHRGLAMLRVLARLAGSAPEQRWVAIAETVLREVEAAAERWHSESARAERVERLREAAARGALVPMAQILDDPASLRQDQRQAQAAEGLIAGLEQQLATIGARLAERRDAARCTAQEITAACGAILLVVMALWRAVS